MTVRPKSINYQSFIITPYSTRSSSYCVNNSKSPQHNYWNVAQGVGVGVILLSSEPAFVYKFNDICRYYYTALLPASSTKQQDDSLVPLIRVVCLLDDCTCYMPRHYTHHIRKMSVAGRQYFVLGKVTSLCFQ